MAGLDLAIELSRKQVIAAAERKLSRPLTESERAGVERIGSLLRLESLGRVFDSTTCTSAEVLTSLAHFAQQGETRLTSQFSSMDNMVEIGRSLFRKVERRMAEEARCDSIGKGITAGNTERYDRVFALWVGLQKAMQHCWSNETRKAIHIPWDCRDTRVQRAWDALTHPRNEVALEILTHQLPDDAQLEIIRQALQVCRERAKN